MLFVALTDVVVIWCKSVASLIVALKILAIIFNVRPSSIPCRFTCGIFWYTLSFLGSGPKGVNPSWSGGPTHAHSTSILIPYAWACFFANVFGIRRRTYRFIIIYRIRYILHKIHYNIQRYFEWYIRRYGVRNIKRYIKDKWQDTSKDKCKDTLKDTYKETLKDTF